MNRNITSLIAGALLVISIGSITHAQTQSPIDGIDARANATEIAKQLASADPHVRQRSAEALAQLAADDQKKLVEGYYLQEKNKEVRLAMDWALYRMGKNEALFRIVRDLDSGRQEQAIGYLAQLDSPDLVYPFLKKQDNPPRVNAGLLKALGRMGNAETLDVIKPYLDSLQPHVAEAAETATDEIAKRLGETGIGPVGTRPRSTAKP